MKKLSCTIALLFFGALALAGPPSATPPAETGTLRRSLETGGRALAAAPLAFESNQGQTDASVRYLARGRGATLFLSAGSAVWRLAGGSAMRLVPVGGRLDAPIQGENPLTGKVNLFFGRDPNNWRSGIATFGQIRYGDVVPGFDWVFYGKGGVLEYDVVVKPGADPSGIRLRWEGADALEIDEHGALLARAGGQQVRQKAPVVYQVAANGDSRQSVAGRFVLFGENEFGFEVGDYDPSRELVIDPEVLFSTYLGGGAGDRARALTVDSEDNVYVAGWTASADYPTQDPLQALPASNLADVFVTKLSADGSTLIYSTYLGGGAGEEAYDIAVDSEGAAYVVGNAGNNFPVTEGAFQTEAANVDEAFVAKLSPDGSSLAYATYLGGGRADDARGIAVDGEGQAYVTGRTASDDFPVTDGSFGSARAMMGNVNDAWVAKLSADGSALVYSGYLGGSDDETGAAIAVWGGNAYVTGSTASTDFPTTEGAYSRMNAGTTDIFVAKLSGDGSGLDYSTYVGGANVESAAGIDVDVFNNAYVAGSSVSTDFPTTEGAFHTERVFGNEIVVFKLNPSGESLVYSTYIGTSSQDRAGAIAVDLQGHAHITGESAAVDFPAVNALQEHGGGADSFVTKLNFAGSALLYSSNLGGSGAEQSGREDSTPYGTSIAVNQNCQVFVTGITDSTDFPTEAPYQAGLAGGDDAFVSKFDLSVSDGSVNIGCNGVVLAPLLPTLRTFAPRSIGTVFGSNFSTMTMPQSELDANGRVVTNLAGVCVEVSGVRGPVFGVIGGPSGQVNFGFPVETGPGWHDVRVIRNCDTEQQEISEPQFVKLEELSPQLFIVLILTPDAPTRVAAYNESNGTYVGSNPAAAVGVAQGAGFQPASPGDAVSIYATGMGQTNPPLETGQIPGGAFPFTGQVELRLGDRVIPPSAILYQGAEPCCAGLDRLTFFIPEDMPAGDHEVVISVNGVESPVGPVLAVAAP